MHLVGFIIVIINSLKNLNRTRDIPDFGTAPQAIAIHFFTMYSSVITYTHTHIYIYIYIYIYIIYGKLRKTEEKNGGGRF